MIGDGKILCEIFRQIQFPEPPTFNASPTQGQKENGDEANNKKLLLALVAGLTLTGTCLATPHGRPGSHHRPAPPPPRHSHHHGGHHHHHGGHNDGWIYLGAAAVGGLIGAIVGGR